MELEPGNCLLVAAVEAFGQTKDRGERANRAPAPAAEVAESALMPIRRRLTMIPGDERDRLDFVRLESAQVAVLDQVVRVLVVPLVRDVDADVVKERCVLQPLALALRERMDAARLIEERHGEA